MPLGDAPRHLIRRLLMTFHRDSASRITYWDDGKPPDPDHRQCIVALDGFLSSSKTHWIYDLRAPLTHAGITTILTGLSYAGVDPDTRLAFEYGPRNTDVVVEDAYRILVPYQPRLLEEHTTVYLGFSLGASLLVKGLADYLQSLRGGMLQKGLTPACIPSVVLIQPGLALTAPHREALEERPNAASGLPAPFADALYRPRYIEQLFLTSISVLKAEGIRVAFAYWPDDQFVEYSSSLLQSLDNLGVTPQKIALPNPSGEAFDDHLQVRKDPTTIQLILAHLEHRHGASASRVERILPLCPHNPSEGR